MDSKFFLYMPWVIIWVSIIVLIYTCIGYKNNDPKIMQRDQKIYLNSDSTVYTKGDTLTLDGRKFIKVWGITHCKYGCPVLIECK